MKFFSYKGCGTCKKAQKYLLAKKVEYSEIAIRENPPSKAEIKSMIKIYGGDIKRLFNTSGRDYREMNIKEKLPKLTETQIIELLSKNGNLIKRPFVMGKNFGLIGFKEDEWKKQFK